MRPSILRIPVAWVAVLLVSCLLWGLGCTAEEAPPVSAGTYTFDKDVKKIINTLAQKGKANPYREFDRNFTGLFVPKSLLALEPFVLGLATESRIPAILLLKAH